MTTRDLDLAGLLGSLDVWAQEDIDRLSDAIERMADFMDAQVKAAVQEMRDMRPEAPGWSGETEEELITRAGSLVATRKKVKDMAREAYQRMGTPASLGEQYAVVVDLASTAFGMSRIIREGVAQ